MRNITLQIAEQAGTCGDALVELERYITNNNITAVSFDEVIAYWKQIDRRDWAYWAYTNKHEFEKLVGAVTTPETLVAHQADIASLSKTKLLGYAVNGVIYPTLEEAKAAQNKNILETIPKAAELIHINLGYTSNDGHEVWATTTLETFIEPEGGWVLYLVNPLTGERRQFTDISSAKIFYEQVVRDILNTQFSNLVSIFEAHQVILEPEEIIYKQLINDIQL